MEQNKYIPLLNKTWNLKDTSKITSRVPLSGSAFGGRQVRGIHLRSACPPGIDGELSLRSKDPARVEQSAARWIRPSLNLLYTHSSLPGWIAQKDLSAQKIQSSAFREVTLGERNYTQVSVQIGARQWRVSRFVAIQCFGGTALCEYSHKHRLMLCSSSDRRTDSWHESSV